MKISVEKDFSSTPGGRLKSMGPNSGEEFRERLLRELKKNANEEIEISLDGEEGYGSSFLEEAFGGLVRSKLFTSPSISNRIKITSPNRINNTYVDEAERYLRDAIKTKFGR